MKNINGISPQHFTETNGISINSKTVFNDRHTPGNPSRIYVEAIAAQLRTSEKVVKHPMLRSERWTEACYEFLAGIVKEELDKTLSREQRMKMGTSLSFRTLQKIILKEYEITYPIDPRRINTLNKVVIFLGYDS
ncbi:MAG: hypothetical protein KDD04_07770, partial [Sinomicrobium sp.]|nr:hypothetical protein [Sinomicrobium sp.]